MAKIFVFQVLESLKDLLNEATWDCSDTGIQLQVEKNSYYPIASMVNSSQKTHWDTFPPTKCYILFQALLHRPWTTPTCRWCRSTWGLTASTSSVATGPSAWAWTSPACPRFWGTCAKNTKFPPCKLFLLQVCRKRRHHHREGPGPSGHCDLHVRESQPGEGLGLRDEAHEPWPGKIAFWTILSFSDHVIS